MEFYILSVIILIICILYIIIKRHLSLDSKTFIVKYDFIDDFVSKVKGRYHKESYFANSHKIVSVGRYKTYSDSHKALFKSCYNVITFKSDSSYWEVFFYHLTETESERRSVLNIRVFPEKNIKSEASIELSFSKLEVHANSRYLAKELEDKQIQKNLSWLVKDGSSSISFFPNNIHYRFFFNSKKYSNDDLLKTIKVLNFIKNKIYRKGVLEY